MLWSINLINRRWFFLVVVCFWWRGYTLFSIFGVFAGCVDFLLKEHWLTPFCHYCHGRHEDWLVTLRRELYTKKGIGEGKLGNFRDLFLLERYNFFVVLNWIWKVWVIIAAEKRWRGNGIRRWWWILFQQVIVKRGWRRFVIGESLHPIPPFFEIVALSSLCFSFSNLLVAFLTSHSFSNWIFLYSFLLLLYII